MNDFLFGIDSPLPLGITVALIVAAWLSLISVVVAGLFS